MPTPAASAGAMSNRYALTALVADQPGVAASMDANLINPWGMSFGAATPLWVSDNGTSVTTLYQGAVHGSAVSIVPLVVKIPHGAPTGQVFNGSGGFDVGKADASSLFMFASENGDISGWSPVAPPPLSMMAHRGWLTPHAVYKGMAIATIGKSTFIYGANFRTGMIDVFDSTFHPVMLDGHFHDSDLPDGYAPFNIQDLGGQLYVSYAKQNGARHDDVAGPGHGFVDVFTTQGKMIRRLASRGMLNSPWGTAIAPSGFGRFSGNLLVGNFGDGHINAYDVKTGDFQGTVQDATGAPIVIDGLWGLKFGNGTMGGTDELLFTAGTGGEKHGLLGIIDAA